MANVKNTWVGFLDRSYLQIKNALLSILPTSNPELTDHSPSNPFVILVDMFAGVAEMLNYYVDNAAEESFIATASRRSSVIRHSIGLDYRIKARNPHSVDVVLTFENTNPSTFLILAGSSIASTTGILYQTVGDITVLAGTTFVSLPMKQITRVSTNLGTSLGVANQQFVISDSYAQSTLQVTIAGDAWDEVSTFANSSALDRHFIVDILEDNLAYLRFGDGNKGAIPLNGQLIATTYSNTRGTNGAVDQLAFDIDTLNLDTSIALPTPIATANNPLASSGGVDFESTESIRANAVRGLRTLDRAVTPQDYLDLLNSVPGIGSSAIAHCCGSDVELYIVPEGGGIAQQVLINEAKDYIDERSTVLLNNIVRSAGEARLFLRIKVYAKPRKGLSETTDQVKQALLNYNETQGIGINSRIRLSDIQGLVDNLSNVEYVDLLELYVEPYARPVGHVNELIWDRVITDNSTQIINYRIEVDVNNEFLIFIDNTLRASIAQGVTYVNPDDSSFSLTINAGSYNIGDRWEFQTYPYLANISLADFSIARITEESLTIQTVKADNPQTSQVC